MNRTGPPDGVICPASNNPADRGLKKSVVVVSATATMSRTIDGRTPLSARNINKATMALQIP
jgi:hypothetical protein